MLERELGTPIPGYLKILLTQEAFTSFAVLGAMPVDIKEKLENTAKSDFMDFDKAQQQELLKKCRNGDINNFKLREGDVILLHLMKSTIVDKGVHYFNDQFLSEYKRRKRSLPKENPGGEDKNADVGPKPEKRQSVAIDSNADLDELRKKIVKITNVWIANSFNCRDKDAYFITEKEVKINITEVSIGTTIKCRICCHDIKILTDAQEGKTIKFIISNFSRHCKTHEPSCKQFQPQNIIENKQVHFDSLRQQQEYRVIKEESPEDINDVNDVNY